MTATRPSSDSRFRSVETNAWSEPPPASGTRLRRPGQGLWLHRRAAPLGLHHRVVLAFLAAFGTVAVFAFAGYWFSATHVGSVAAYLLLSLAFCFGMARLLFSWLTIAAMKDSGSPAAPSGMSVAVFTTAAPGEPLRMFEKTFRALSRVRYPHTSYLLDGTGDVRYRELAERFGVVWIDCRGVTGAKAGKVNAALARTTEDFILVLDPDHVPFPEFLDRVLGHFGDERVGFVQVSQAYYNQHRSPVARGAAEQTYAFYGPLQMGMYGLGAAVAIGANCTFRRSALESVGGHAVALAEDLVTSIRLHAGGWRSVYVPEVLSRGLVPEDLGAFYAQQLKWATGAVDMLFTEYPALFGKLGWGQRIVYLTIGTYYFIGPFAAVYTLLPYLALWLGIIPVNVDLGAFATAVLPVALVSLTYLVYLQRWYCDPESERGVHWRGMLLKAATWPVYLVGTARAIADRLVPYTPTRKQAERPAFLRLCGPHLVLAGAFVCTLAFTVHTRLVTLGAEHLWLGGEAVWLMLAFASCTLFTSLGGVAWAGSLPRRSSGEAWAEVPPAIQNAEAA